MRRAPRRPVHMRVRVRVPARICRRVLRVRALARARRGTSGSVAPACRRHPVVYTGECPVSTTPSCPCQCCGCTRGPRSPPARAPTHPHATAPCCPHSGWCLQHASPQREPGFRASPPARPLPQARTHHGYTPAPTSHRARPPPPPRLCGFARQCFPLPPAPPCAHAPRTHPRGRCDHPAPPDRRLAPHGQEGANRCRPGCQ